MIRNSLLNRIDQARLIQTYRRTLGHQSSGAMAGGLIVSLTSFPARINQAWVSIESILRQRVRPELIVLCLCESEFGNRHDLPEEIKTQTKLGLEIIWVQQRLRSYGKLIPARQAYPAATIITVDDDIIYPEEMIADLLEEHQQAPAAITGRRGYAMIRDAGQTFAPYTSWPQATAQTSSETCLLTGVGGILYPPSSLATESSHDLELIHALCPTADDIWFWAMSRLAGDQRRCLGQHQVREIKRLIKTPRLSKTNVSRGGNDRQLSRVVDYFQL